MITEAHRQQLRDLKVETLAKTFADVLLEWLEKEQFEQMQRDNTECGQPNLCASHDYCDANMAMADAMSRCTTPDFNPTDFMEEYNDLVTDKGVEVANAHESKMIFDKWNAAWALAYKLYLTVQPEFEQCPDIILEHLKAPAGWSWEHGSFWAITSGGRNYALGNANGHLTCDIYVKDDVVEVKDFATVAAAIQFMQEVARA